MTQSDHICHNNVNSSLGIRERFLHKNCDFKMQVRFKGQVLETEVHGMSRLKFCLKSFKKSHLSRKYMGGRENGILKFSLSLE